ncbi:hypothetical protein MUK42_15436 [Musa troglodytarum]|uniref:Uncharacterized protein n=1 Tax=Musa troglodytarum TaxID=320322 RepID=A0A9E7I5Y0_9LILI|nr:hypothetical protein MUK42_15436 [Musa troglodytarum]
MDSESVPVAKASSEEVDVTGITKMESVIRWKEVENGGQAIYGQAPLVEDNDHPEVRDDAFIEIIGGRKVYPATPSPDRDSSELPSSYDQSEELDSILDCRTPTENMFDPFAPGPEELVFAPKKKMLKGTQVPPRRQLNFNDCGDSNQQIKETSVKNVPLHGDTCECLKTPISLPLLTGVAGTCPPAPRREAAKSRTFRLGAEALVTSELINLIRNFAELWE